MFSYEVSLLFFFKDDQAEICLSRLQEIIMKLVKRSQLEVWIVQIYNKSAEKLVDFCLLWLKKLKLYV